MAALRPRSYYQGSSRTESGQDRLSLARAYKARHHDRIMWQRRGARLVVLGTTARPTGWVLEYYRKGTS